MGEVQTRSQPDWSRLRWYYGLFNQVEHIEAAVRELSGAGQLEPSAAAAGTLDFIDSPFSAHLILSSLQLDGTARVIDVGAGLGGSSRLYASTGARVTAVDVLEEQVLAHRELNELWGASNVEVVCADAQELPFPDRSFTHYTSIGALCHTYDRGAALSEAHRVMEDGGRLAIVDCVAGGAAGREYWGDRFWRLVPGSEYVSLAREVGFENVKADDIRLEYASQLSLYLRTIDKARRLFEVRFGGEKRLNAALETYRGFLDGFESGKVDVLWLQARR